MSIAYLLLIMLAIGAGAWVGLRVVDWLWEKWQRD